MRAVRRGGGWREEEGVQRSGRLQFQQTNCGVQWPFSLCGRRHRALFSAVTSSCIYKPEWKRSRTRWWIFSRRCGTNYSLCQRPILWSWEPSLSSFCLLPQFSSWSYSPAVTAAAVESQNTRPPEWSHYNLSDVKTENRLRTSVKPGSHYVSLTWYKAFTTHVTVLIFQCYWFPGENHQRGLINGRIFIWYSHGSESHGTGICLNLQSGTTDHSGFITNRDNGTLCGNLFNEQRNSGNKCRKMTCPWTPQWLFYDTSNGLLKFIKNVKNNM